MNRFKKLDPNTLQLKSGKYVDPLRLREQDVCVEDIAWPLARMCRFGGHIEVTVADHCLTVAGALSLDDPLTRLHALMHDAAEAYVVDVPRGIKRRDEMRFFRAAEDRALRVIFASLGIPPACCSHMTSRIEEADLVVCIAEARERFPDRGEGFASATPERLASADALIGRGGCWRYTPKRKTMTIATEFLHTYHSLRKEVGV